LLINELLLVLKCKTDSLIVSFTYCIWSEQPSYKEHQY